MLGAGQWGYRRGVAGGGAVCNVSIDYGRLPSRIIRPPRTAVSASPYCNIHAFGSTPLVANRRTGPCPPVKVTSLVTRVHVSAASSECDLFLEVQHGAPVSVTLPEKPKLGAREGRRPQRTTVRPAPGLSRSLVPLGGSWSTKLAASTSISVGHVCSYRSGAGDLDISQNVYLERTLTISSRNIHI